MARIDVGDTAPDLTLSTHAGEQVTLAEYRGKNAVVLFFYPKDGMPMCTKEACHFRDSYEDFVEAGATVIGISADTDKRHQDFAANHRLPYILVSDKKGKARRTFGVPKTMGFLPGRVTYVIDKEGVVRHIFSAQFDPDRHVQESLEVVRKLNAS